MPNFRDALADDRVYIFDGAYGTLFQHRGLPAGMSPELFGLERPDVVRQAHADYLAAGADMLTTNTFGGSGPKLEGKTAVTEFNRRMAAVAREVADAHMASPARGGRPVYVAGSVGPTGLFVEPLGPLTFRELVDIFAEQIRGLAQGGADFIKAETHFDLAEAKAVVVAARRVCDLPVMISMTFEGMASLTGTPPETFVDTMQNLGVDAVALNCGAGPEQMAALVRRLLPRLQTPYHVQPNAGLPELVDGQTVFRLGPDDFAQECRVFLELGAKCVGGCCGAGPEHIAALSKALQGNGRARWQKPVASEAPCMALTSRTRSVLVGPGRPLAIIGERINPTGKKQLSAEFQAGQLAEALRFADEQLDAGATLLDVNVGAPMVDEVALLPALAKALVERFQAPLSLDTTDPRALEAALWAMPASPLVNSISGEAGRMETLGPLCKTLGAPFILLPLKGKKLPVTAAERIAIIEELLEQADGLGIPRRLVMVDALALTVSSKPEAAKASLEVIRHCTEVLGLPTVIGLSNISFGLPARELVNGTFLAMCMAAGLSACIANPSTGRLREARAASEVLLGRDPAAENFIAGYSGWTAGGGGAGGTPGHGAAGGAKAKVETLHQAVVAGAKDVIVAMVEDALAQGRPPFAVVGDELIPGIMEVGEKYERREYFLPQLMLSAETMQLGFERLRPLLEDEGQAGAKPRIVMATVEGDIHDIGKNIVCLLLKNHGFEVVDLGKDVPAADIVAAARRENAAIIGLSALMTTTMVRMGDVVELAREQGLKSRIIVGGAVVTQAFADSIGADGYAADAVAAAKLAKRLLEA